MVERRAKITLDVDNVCHDLAVIEEKHQGAVHEQEEMMKTMRARCATRRRLANYT